MLTTATMPRPFGNPTDNSRKVQGAMARTFKIADHVIGGDPPRCFIIAEVGLTHDGSIGLAHNFIDAVASVKADAVKFQVHMPDIEVPAEEASRRAYYHRTAFGPSEWRDLKFYAAEQGIIFLASPFTVAAVEMLEGLGVPAWKIASGEVTNRPLQDAIMATRKPIIASTGLSTTDEITRLHRQLAWGSQTFALLQCASRYPTTYNAVGLNAMVDMMAAYDEPVGLSDHSGTIWPSVAAMAMGASVIEVHVTMSRHMYGPDVESSVTLDELGQIVQARNAIYTMATHPVDKTRLTEAQQTTRAIFEARHAYQASLAEASVVGARVEWRASDEFIAEAEAPT